MTFVATGILVLVGGALGAVARFVITEVLAARRLARVARRGGQWFPSGTLTVNLLGSFLLGVVAGLADLGSAGGPGGLALLGIGLCGALTTFSTLAMDVVTLIEERRWTALTGYLLATLIGGLGAAAAGLALVARVG